MNNETTQLAFGEQPQIDTMGIDMSAILDEYRLSSSYVEQYTRDFVQLDSIVDAIPTNADPSVPFVGDTTLAGIVRSLPRNSLQQLPVFSVCINGTKVSIPALVSTFLLKKTAFNEDTFGKGLLSTLQIGAEQALTHGYAPFMCATGSMFNDFGTTLRLMHFSDSSPEPGITDHNETGYDYVVANLTTSRVKKILKAALNNPNTSWNTHALQRVLDATPRAKDYSIYESAARKNAAGAAAGPTYQFITRYPVGSPDEPIITFCPEVDDEPLRVFEPRSKWGYARVMYLVIDPAPLTPFGISRVRLASPNQNLMNIYYGNIASMLLLNSKPPIFKRGRFLKPVQLKQGAVWESNDPNAVAELKNLDNGSLEQFVTMAQQFSGQIKNIMGDPRTTPTAASGNYSKVGPGVKMQQQDIDVSTNQITKILENFLRQYALVALDTLLSEQEGEDDLIVDDETKNAINAIAPGTIGDDNKIHIVWADFYAAIEDWSVDIDVSLSKDELEEKKRGDAQDMLTVLGQNAQILGPSAVAKVDKISDELMSDMTPVAAKAATLAPQQPAMPAPQQPTPAQPMQ